MRIRRQFRREATISKVAAQLHCPRCHHRPEASSVHPQKCGI
jgi:hypothetical protein